ncbi:MAG: SbcC/MukB-like Walker B domain-containing protein [Clostridiales bacterium]|nr:SbcC/MukB-like Walker B domain-containing protein [Clostridiales bacterium]
MRPLLMKIKGINSFSEEQSVDFRALTQQGFFGIFGPTGSGKSTILDGITLALYGVIARKSANFIHTGERRGYVCFEFAIRRKNEHCYRAEREFRLDEKTGSARAGRCLLTDITGEEPVILADSVREMNRCCREIIGLSSEDFLRTVVLPQGKFSEFLELKGNERNNMLERLFRLERYGEELSARLKQRSAAVKEALARLSGEAQAYGELDETILADKKKEWEDLCRRMTKTEEAGRQARELAEQAREVNGLQEDWKRACLEKDSLEADKDRMEERQERLLRAEKALPVLAAWEEFCRCRDRREKTAATAAECQGKREAAGEKLQKAKQKLEEVLTKKDEKLELLDEKRNRLKDTIRIETDREEAAAAVRKWNGEKVQAESRLSLCQRQEEESRDGSRECRERMEAAEQIWKNVPDRSQDKLLAEEAFRWEQETESWQKEKSRWEAQLRTDKKEEQQSQEKIICLQGELEEAVRHWEQAKTKREDEFFYRWRHHLEEGKPCPLCGALHHPAAGEHFSEKNVPGDRFGESIPEKQQEESCWEENLQDKNRNDNLSGESFWEEKQRTLREELLRQTWRREKLEEQIREQEEEIRKKEEEYRRIKDSCDRRKAELDCGDLARYLEHLRRQEEEKKKAMDQWAHWSQELSGRQKEEEIFRRESQEAEQQLEKCRLQLQIFTSREEECQKTIRNLWENPAIQDFPALKEWESMLRQTEQEKEELLCRVQEAEQEYQHGLDEWNQWTLRSNTWMAREEEQKQAETAAEKHLEKLLELQGFEHREEAEQSLMTEKEIQKEKAEMEEFSRNWEKNQGKLADLQEKLRGRRVTKEELAEAEAEERRLQDQYKAEEKQEIRIRKEWEDMEERWTKLQKIKKREKELQSLEDQLEELRKLFAGKKFVQYAAMEKLRYVALEASGILYTVSAGQYGLETGEEGTFFIRDYRNGGCLRDPSTLSGGETFLVSLALALSLSSQIQLTNQAPLELFFLDEGFGTLDEEKLHEVLDALERLPGSRRTIGLISHVSEIQNRVPVRLMISPAQIGGKGSQIRLEQNG